MMLIKYEKGVFNLFCDWDENEIALALPDRRFMKRQKCWRVPPLRRNIDYMRVHLNDSILYTEEAWAAFQDKLGEIASKKQPLVPFPSWYKPKTAPYKVQKECFDKAHNVDSFAILFEQGMGKTYTSINLACYWRMINEIDAVLVLCPSSVKMVWPKELDKHCSIDRQDHTMRSGKYKHYLDFVEQKHDFAWVIAGIESLSQGKGYEYLMKFVTTRRCLVIEDESSDIANPFSTRTEKAIALSKEGKKSVILSGTAQMKGLENFFSQYMYLDPDILGYDSYYSFRSRYCKMISIQVTEDRSVPKIVGYQNEQEFFGMVERYTMRAEKADYFDLPEKVYLPRRVEMNPEQKKVYNSMKYEYALPEDMEDITEYEVTNTLEHALRLQQISGGFMPQKDVGEVNTRLIPIKGKNPKVEELVRISREIDGKFIVWFRFRPELQAAKERFKKEEIGTAEFHGDLDDLEKEYNVSRFENDKDCRVMLATKAMARGHSMSFCTFAVYFSYDFDLISYLQSEDRILRVDERTLERKKNDKNACCTYIMLEASDNDRTILQNLQDKKTVVQFVYDVMKTWNNRN